MTRWTLLAVVAVAACGGRNRDGNTLSPARAASPAAVDSLWNSAESLVRHGKWSKAQKALERVILELSPDDPRFPRARYYMGEAHLGQGNHLEAAREFRKAVDDSPDNPIAADALLRVGDAYADMWRRPELDPTYGETALASYQELLSRYPNAVAADRAQLKIVELNERFAYKAYRAALYYFRLKAYDSAILYLRDLIANYPKTSITPEALAKLIQVYQKLGYQESVQEMCSYSRRYHPEAKTLLALCPAQPDTAATP